MVLVEFEWEGVECGYFDLSLIIEEYVFRSDISEEFVGVEGFGFGLDHGVEEVPHVLFVEFLLFVEAVVDLVIEEIGVVGVVYLFVVSDTSTVPAVPQSEVLVNACWRGRKRVGLWG